MKISFNPRQEDGGHNEAFAYISYIGSGLSLIGLSFTLLCYVLLQYVIANIFYLFYNESLKYIVFAFQCFSAEFNFVLKYCASLPFFFPNYSKDLQVLNSTRHVVHLNLQLSLGLTQIIFLSGAGKTDAKVSCLRLVVFSAKF